MDKIRRGRTGIDIASISVDEHSSAANSLFDDVTCVAHDVACCSI